MSTDMMAASAEPDRQIGLSTDGNQYLTFTLGDECYGVDILRVQEIKGYQPATRIPTTPSFINGVINLRGTIVPIVDLRAKLAMDRIEYTPSTVVVVVVVCDRVMGLVVDAVSDVLNLSGDAIQPTPNFGNRVRVDFIQGIAKSGDRLITLLNIDRVLSEDDLNELSAVVAA